VQRSLPRRTSAEAPAVVARERRTTSPGPPKRCWRGGGWAKTRDNANPRLPQTRALSRPARERGLATHPGRGSPAPSILEQAPIFFQDRNGGRCGVRAVLRKGGTRGRSGGLDAVQRLVTWVKAAFPPTGPEGAARGMVAMGVRVGEPVARDESGLGPACRPGSGGSSLSSAGPGKASLGACWRVSSRHPCPEARTAGATMLRGARWKEGRWGERHDLGLIGINVGRRRSGVWSGRPPHHQPRAAGSHSRSYERGRHCDLGANVRRVRCGHPGRQGSLTYTLSLASRFWSCVPTDVHGTWQGPAPSDC
jgi:hypothetical protein